MKTWPLVLVGALVASEARAVTVVVKNLDPAGEGFNDATVAAPVGGNPGTTVGQQRLGVFNRAAQLWGAALQGTVPIEIDANFAPLPCMGGTIVLGNARPATFLANVPGVSVDQWLPVALVNQLTGSDQSPGESEIEATFNGGLAACSGGRLDWYYGLDGKAGDKSDLLSVVLHELGHGLGFTTVMSSTTGETKSNRFDPYAAHVFDTALGQSWTALTPLQRVTSVRTPRALVFDGPNVIRQAAQILALGSPTLRAAPPLTGLTARVAEAEFGPSAADRSASGRLMVGTLSPGTCDFQGSATGAVVLITQRICAPIQEAFNAQQAGAVAVLIKDDDGNDPPLTVDVQPSHRALFNMTVPVLSVSSADAAVLAAAPAGTALQVAAEPLTRVGADPNGRPMLFASNPVRPGSTLSHWEMLERPNLMMEPVQAPDAVHDMRMELALFRDLGWTTTCGNGTLDSGEACDQGAQNGAPGSTCRSDCTPGSSGSNDAGPVGDHADAAAGGATGTDASPGTGGADASIGTGGIGTGGIGTGGIVAGGADASIGTGGQGGALPRDAAMGPADSGGLIPDARAAGGADGGVSPDVAPDLAPATGGAGGVVGGVVSPDAGLPVTARDDLVGGCSCRTGGRGQAPGWLALMAVAIAVRRRRRR